MKYSATISVSWDTTDMVVPGGDHGLEAAYSYIHACLEGNADWPDDPPPLVAVVPT